MLLHLLLSELDGKTNIATNFINTSSTRSSDTTEGPRIGVLSAMLVNSCYVSRATGVTKVSNSKHDLQGHSRALAIAMVPFDRPHSLFPKSASLTSTMQITTSGGKFNIFWQAHGQNVPLRLHQNTPFQVKKIIFFWRGGHSLLPRPLPWWERVPPPYALPSAPTKPSGSTLRPPEFQPDLRH